VYSQSYLGYSYYSGSELVSYKDYEQAFEYLLATINNRDFISLSDEVKALVCRSLSSCYRYGRGCDEDQSLASYFTELAAKYGDEGSQKVTSIIRRD
jgi:TPR repeat protein